MSCSSIQTANLTSIFTFTRMLKCCYCFSPKTGIQILALSGITMSTLSFLSSATNAGSREGDQLDQLSIDGELNGLLTRDDWKYFHVFSMVINIMSVIINSLLILGVRQNKPSLMFPSVCVHFTSLLFLIPLTLTTFAIPNLSVGAAFGMFLVLLCFLTIAINWFYIIYWYYEKLRTEKSESLSDHKICSPSGI